MIPYSIDCVCKNASVTIDDKKHWFEQFVGIREECSALRDILVPDSIWEDFQRTALEQMDDARHKPITLMAFKFGCLGKITSPIHRYLLENGKPKKELKDQYKQDLRELWMIQKRHVLPRHQKSRGYLGKLIELQLAEWIEDQGWKIYNLEALCGNADIEAISPDGVESAIEIKYIGEEDEIFLHSIENCGGTFCPYSGSNYMLFRSYEAAKQLHECPKKRIVFIVISNLSWSFMEIPINENWIHWRSPEFLKAGQEWEKFIEGQNRRYPDIETDLQTALCGLDQIWIIRQNDDFIYSLNRIVEM